MAGFQIDDPAWFSVSKIFGAAPVIMIFETFVDICADARIKAFVGTENDIDRPIRFHRIPVASCAVCQRYDLSWSANRF